MLDAKVFSCNMWLFQKVGVKMGGYGPDMSALTLLSKDSLTRVFNSIPGRWG